MNTPTSPFQQKNNIHNNYKRSVVKKITQFTRETYIYIFDSIKEIDHILFGAIIILFLISATLSFISTFNISLKELGNPYHMTWKHIFNLLASLSIIIAFLFIRIEKIYKYPLTLYSFSVIILSAVFVEGIGQEVAGAKRWISINKFNFQPAEFVKFILFFILSQQITKKEIGKNIFRQKIFPAFFVLSSICGLIMIEPDLSTAFIVFLSGFALFMSSSMRIVHIASTLVFLLPFGILFLQSKRYYLSRLLFFRPELEPHGRGYHLLQSFKTFHHGGIKGKTISESLNHLATLPDAHNDFVFAVVASISGIIGVLFVEIMFLIVIIRGLIIAKRQLNDRFYYLCLGFTYLIGTQATLHMLVTIGLIPTTGVTLPFLSYGGSAIIANGMMMGTILRFSRHSIIKQNTP